MQQTSRSKVAVLPFLLFIVIPILAFLVFKKYGLIFFALFLNPIGTVINQIFARFYITPQHLRIKSLFHNKTIPIDHIRYVTHIEANSFQKIFWGLPNTYYLVGYNITEEITVTPRKELIFNPQTNQLYFKN